VSFKRFYFLSFFFSLQHGFAQNLFKKRRHIVLCIGFSIEEKGVSFQRKKKTEILRV